MTVISERFPLKLISIFQVSSSSSMREFSLWELAAWGALRQLTWLAQVLAQLAWSMAIL